MEIFNIKNKFIFLFISIQFVLNYPFINKAIKAEINTSAPSNSYLKNFPTRDPYILGPGDTIFVEINEKTKDLNFKTTINGEGIANFKRLKKVYISGLSKQELSNILNKEYSKYVKDPNVSIKIISFRPVKVFIDGEVDQPGFYILPGALNLKDKSNMKKSDLLINDESIYSESPIIFPTLIDALRKAGGITSKADLNNIKIVRKETITNGSGKKVGNIQLLNSINSYETNNIRIFDEDIIVIQKSNKPIIEQISRAMKLNINPRFISVYVGGRVIKEGQIKTPRTSTLTDAIAIAGGTRVLKGPINFIRYDGDGTIDKRKFPYRKSATRGSYQNPFLKNGDIIFVDRNIINSSNEVITEITNPFVGLFQGYTLYKAISD